MSYSLLQTSTQISMHIYVHSDQGLHHSIYRFIKVQRVSKKNAKTDQATCMPRLFIISAHFAHATRSLFSVMALTYDSVEK